MKKFDHVLLVTDFDGTLNDDHGNTPACVLDAISYFTKNGGSFSISTGRTFQGLRAYPHKNYINAPALLSNGAMAYDYQKERVCFLDGLGESCFPVIRQIVAEFPDVSVEMYPINDTYAIHISPLTERHFTNQGLPYTEIEDPSIAPIPWAKVMLGCPAERSEAVQDFLTQFSQISFLRTTGSFVEILHPGVNKGSGLLRLADFLGVEQDHIYAVGDGYNDVDMLVTAGAAFVPCNGSKEALQVATHVVRSNNAGAVAHVIEILDSMY